MSFSFNQTIIQLPTHPSNKTPTSARRPESNRTHNPYSLSPTKSFSPTKYSYSCRPQPSPPSYMPTADLPTGTAAPPTFPQILLNNPPTLRPTNPNHQPNKNSTPCRRPQIFFIIKFSKIYILHLKSHTTSHPQLCQPATDFVDECPRAAPSARTGPTPETPPIYFMEKPRNLPSPIPPSPPHFLGYILAGVLGRGGGPRLSRPPPCALLAVRFVPPAAGCAPFLYFPFYDDVFSNINLYFIIYKLTLFLT